MDRVIFKSNRADVLVGVAFKACILGLALILGVKDHLSLFCKVAVIIGAVAWWLFRSFERLFSRELRLENGQVYFVVNGWKIKVDTDRAALTIRDENYGDRIAIFALVLALNKSNFLCWFFKNVMLLKYRKKGEDLAMEMENLGRQFGVRVIPFREDLWN